MFYIYLRWYFSSTFDSVAGLEPPTLLLDNQFCLLTHSRPEPKPFPGLRSLVNNKGSCHHNLHCTLRGKLEFTAAPPHPLQHLYANVSLSRAGNAVASALICCHTCSGNKLLTGAFYRLISLDCFGEEVTGFFPSRSCAGLYNYARCLPFILSD